MVFNATFNSISVISWRSVLVVKEYTGKTNDLDLSLITDILYHVMLYQEHLRDVRDSNFMSNNFTDLILKVHE